MMSTLLAESCLPKSVCIGQDCHSYIVFGADPFCFGITLSCLSNLVNQWSDSYQICMDTSLGQGKELIKFG